MATLVVLAACGASEDEPTVFQTLPEVTPTPSTAATSPSAPSGPEATPPSSAAPSVPAGPEATPTDGDGSDSDGSDGGSVNGAAAAPSDPADIARELGLEGMIELIGQDPEAAGERGEDLLRELERVRDKPDDKRIERALDRLRDWADDGDIHPDVAEAIRVVLTELEAAPDSEDPDNADPDNPDNPDNHEDDDDDD
ncbi:hypothetical protein DVS28_a1847 [Euzebya pacifica]|uniref:Uncharacterized protein n=1 Tax=Euzebya pacifica TaxID=1608957 RepID=A0A346XWE1_9ACTN|nr:hypothetical protein DVS28_a1847 [Euzebya pacifica]